MEVSYFLRNFISCYVNNHKNNEVQLTLKLFVLQTSVLWLWYELK